MKAFPFTYQLDAMDCGPACLKMVGSWYGAHFALPDLRRACHIARDGVSVAGLSDASEQMGFRTIAVKIGLDSLPQQPGLRDFPLPCIVYWEQRHFVVVYKIKGDWIWIADPAHGKRKLPMKSFLESWTDATGKGIALGLEPGPDFQKTQSESRTSWAPWNGLMSYLTPFRKLLIQFGIGILTGIILQILFPFLTQALIDVGVQQQNLSFVGLVLLAQIILFFSQSFIQFIQSWILLQIGKRINVQLISDFLYRLMNLPIGYFDSKNSGDILQRIHDNQRVEQFLTGSVLHIFFSLISLLVFSLILLYYNGTIFFLFTLFSLLYLAWVFLFLKRRAILDSQAFQQASDHQQTLFEIVTGMQEIKLQGSERKRRWQWINIQAILFGIQSKALALKQYQEGGALFFSRLKDILISFVAARAVIQGEITLGALVAIQYIVGALHAPFEQFIDFIRSAQDARLSLQRMQEITDTPPEQDPGLEAITDLPHQPEIRINNLSFRYSALEKPVLQQISAVIPFGKTTAIVGPSGSGKTTLLKLLLGFYAATEGQILVGDVPLQLLDKKSWRKQCGTVMQDGFLFSDTIASNIAESSETLDLKLLDKAMKVAYLDSFVYSLPLSHHTKIGATGSGISQGQKQRILLARAAYKNPDFLFFDEATNALDATSEKIIMANLLEYFRQKTLVLVAHRLSTVKNADQILVLNEGRLVEAGTHAALIQKKGFYFNLVKDQLELG